jgi:hypothetical protein
MPNTHSSLAGSNSLPQDPLLVASLINVELLRCSRATDSDWSSLSKQPAKLA